MPDSIYLAERCHNWSENDACEARAACSETVAKIKLLAFETACRVFAAEEAYNVSV